MQMQIEPDKHSNNPQISRKKFSFQIFQIHHMFRFYIEQGSNFKQILYLSSFEIIYLYLC